MVKLRTLVLGTTFAFVTGFGAGRCDIKSVKNYFTGVEKRTEKLYDIAEEAYDYPKPYLSEKKEEKPRK